MRSVVVVLPASMWAMMPILRVLSSGCRSGMTIPCGWQRLVTHRSEPDVGAQAADDPQLSDEKAGGTAVTHHDRTAIARFRSLYECRTEKRSDYRSRPRWIRCHGLAIDDPLADCAAWPCRPRRASFDHFGRRQFAGVLPAIVRERLVRFGHLVQVFAALDRCTDRVRRVDDLGGETLGHGALAPLPRKAHDPADREGIGPAGADFDRHLVGGAADAAAAHLELRLDVVDGALERRDGLAGGLLADDRHAVVDDALRGVALAPLQDLVDELSDDDGSVDRIGVHLAPGRRSFARHVTTPSWRRSGYGLACDRARPTCRACRG